MRDLLGVAGVGFASALLPFVNIETLLAVRAAVSSVELMWALALVAALGQMAGKLVWYYLGANSLHWRWVRRKVEQPKNAARLELWRARVGKEAVVNGSVLMRDVVVGDSAHLLDCVVGPGARIGAGVELRGVTVGDGAVVDAAVEPGTRVPGGA